MEGETTAVFLGAGPEERDEFCTVERLLEQKRAMERREELRRISMMRRVETMKERLLDSKLGRNLVDKLKTGPLHKKKKKTARSHRSYSLRGFRKSGGGLRHNHRRISSDEDLGKQMTHQISVEKKKLEQERELRDLEEMQVVGKTSIAKLQQHIHNHITRMYNHRLTIKPDGPPQANRKKSSVLVTSIKDQEEQEKQAREIYRQQSRFFIETFFQLPSHRQKVLDKLSTEELQKIKDVERAKIKSQSSMNKMDQVNGKRSESPSTAENPLSASPPPPPPLPKYSRSVPPTTLPSSSRTPLQASATTPLSPPSSFTSGGTPMSSFSTYPTSGASLSPSSSGTPLSPPSKYPTTDMLTSSSSMPLSPPSSSDTPQSPPTSHSTSETPMAVHPMSPSPSPPLLDLTSPVGVNSKRMSVDSDEDTDGEMAGQGKEVKYYMMAKPIQMSSEQKCYSEHVQETTSYYYSEERAALNEDTEPVDEAEEVEALFLRGESDDVAVLEGEAENICEVVRRKKVSIDRHSEPQLLQSPAQFDNPEVYPESFPDITAQEGSDSAMYSQPGQISMEGEGEDDRAPPRPSSLSFPSPQLSLSMTSEDLAAQMAFASHSTSHGFYSSLEVDVDPFAKEFQAGVKEEKSGRCRGDSTTSPISVSRQISEMLITPHPLTVKDSKTKIPRRAFSDPEFINYIKTLDHDPEVSDYITYRMRVIGDIVEKRYADKLSQAMDEIFFEVLKQSVSWSMFSSISRRLLLEGARIQDGILLIPCFARQLINYVPHLGDTIGHYTESILDKYAADSILGMGGWSSLMESYMENGGYEDGVMIDRESGTVLAATVGDTYDPPLGRHRASQVYPPTDCSQASNPFGPGSSATLPKRFSPGAHHQSQHTIYPVSNDDKSASIPREPHTLRLGRWNSVEVLFEEPVDDKEDAESLKETHTPHLGAQALHYSYSRSISTNSLDLATPTSLSLVQSRSCYVCDSSSPVVNIPSNVALAKEGSFLPTLLEEIPFSAHGPEDGIANGFGVIGRNSAMSEARVSHLQSSESVSSGEYMQNLYSNSNTLDHSHDQTHPSQGGSSSSSVDDVDQGNHMHNEQGHVKKGRSVSEGAAVNGQRRKSEPTSRERTQSEPRPERRRSLVADVILPVSTTVIHIVAVGFMYFSRE